MKKLKLIAQELFIWARGRFSLTGEEKFWLLIVLIILWTGLLGRYLYLKNQNADLLTDRQIEHIFSP